MATQRSEHAAMQIEVAELNRNCLLAPPVAELSRSSIHIWQFPLTSSQLAFEAFADVLSPDESTRASRFHFERDRRRFTIARASVRSILGAYVGSQNRDIIFDYAHYGKPSLADASSGIGFSVSHSDELAMLAVARDQELGVDLELIRSDVETDKLADRFFSPRERDSIRGLPESEKVPAFFRCWTCKEAFLKAQGLGLSRSLDSFDVEVDSQLPARLLATRPDPQEAIRWFLHDIPVEAAYRAALAVDGSIRAMRIFRCR